MSLVSLMNILKANEIVFCLRERGKQTRDQRSKINAFMERLSLNSLMFSLKSESYLERVLNK